MTWVYTAPVILIGLVFLILLLIFLEVGFRAHRWVKPGAQRPEGGQEFLLSAVLGLMALLLGFTFSISLARYDARRLLVVQEANALGTTWLRVQLLEEPYRDEMSGLLKAYVDRRLAWSETSGGPADTAAVQDRLWTAAGRMIRGESSFVLARGVMESLNESIDTQAARVAAGAAHIPGPVLTVLGLYALLTMVMLGYVLAIGGRPHRVATSLLLVLLTLAVMVVLDLDRPRAGSIRVSQQPMIDLRTSMR